MIEKRLLRELRPYCQQIIEIIMADAVLALIIACRCFYLADIIAKMLFSHLNIKAAVPLLALLLFLFIAEAIVNFGISYKAHAVSTLIQKNIRCAFIHKLTVSSPLSTIYNVDLLPMATKEVDSFDPYFSKFLPQLIKALLMPFFILFIAFYNDWVSGLIFLFTLPLIPFFMMLIGKKAQLENAKQWQALSSLGRKFTEILSGMAVIKLYNQGKRQLERTIAISDGFSQAVLKVLRIAFISAFFLELIATLSIAVIAVNIGLRLLYGQVDFLPVFFILLLAPEFYKPLRQMGSMFHDAMGAISNAGRIFAIIDDADTAENKDELHLTSAPQLDFSAVSFCYADSGKAALQELQMRFAAGSVTALIGRSGAGKSTILSLLMGFISPTQGKIYVDDIDLGKVNIKSWRRYIAYVPQRAHIFNATLRENICMGRCVTDRELIGSIKAAGLQELVAKLPHGLDTMVGSARSFSTGQTRRIAMARAFLSKAYVLLLDEPLEGLDVITEEIVCEGLQRMAKNKTVVVIAHRLVSVKNADNIYVLDTGRVMQSGTEKKLRQEQGIYQQMLEESQRSRKI